MERDRVQESPIKRQKLHNGYRPTGRPQSDTIPTQPLSHTNKNTGFSVAGLLSQIESGTPTSASYMTQPTQPYHPAIEVNRSSPPVGSSPVSKPQAPPRNNPQQSSGGLKRPGIGSRLAPPGTNFRRPQGIIPKPSPIDLTDDDDEIKDPPIERSSDDEMQHMRSTIKPTNFHKGGMSTSTDRVKESPTMPSSASFKSITSQFTYDPKSAGAGGMESAYGGVSRTKPATAQRISSKPQQPDMTLDDIADYDVRDKVQRMKTTIFPGKSIRVLVNALRLKKGNFDDACGYLVEEDELAASAIVDLTSSDMDDINDSKPAARPMKPAAKQEIKAPAKTILEKYGGNVAKPRPTGSEPAAADEPPKRKRLVQANRSTPISRTGSPSPLKPSTDIKKKAITRIDSDSENEDVMTDPESEQEIESSDFHTRMLDFFNTCTAENLADMSNEKLEIANFIITKRPFADLDQVNAVSNATTKSKNRARKTIGEKVYDVCEEMMRGYEAVDGLVEQCNNIGKPITDTMKQWGIDIAAATKDGELALTNLEDSLSHDSGIGTPASSILDDEDDIVRPKKAAQKNKHTIFLKKPTIMSPDLVLKDYQLFGLNWLNLLWSKKLSCILADDMGLGKTCQVITFLAHLKETGVEGPHLIVVPGSTLENWIRELHRFCPALTVSPYYGSLVEREDWRARYESGEDSWDVIVTTYETVIGKYDAPFFRKTVRPVVAVFDEGHALKNRTSKRHIELMRIPATFRLLLTGTPLQNNLQELVSLLSFILPKLITSDIRDNLDGIFKFKATTKDADHAALLSAQRIMRARSMMTPFILRRKKAQVLKHLPTKTRRVEYCTMVPEQKDVYAEMVAEALRIKGLTPLQRNGKGGSAKMAQEMTALRFAAIHPLLLRHKYTDKDIRKICKALERSAEFGGNRPDQIEKYVKEDLKGGDFGLHRFCYERPDVLARFALQDDEWMNSGKVLKLKELLERFIANGDRVLIFSQFTTMMNILEAVFENLNIKFMRLDGSTNMSERQDIIDQFTNDTSIPVFMLSTKAGGAGINLACANKVVIFDSSFNPQDDIQAENRAHRVGQTRDVEVVRLVTRGTIEEQIHALGESKLALDDRVAGGDVGNEKKVEAEAESKVEEMFFKALEGKQDEGEDSEAKEEKDGEVAVKTDVKEDGDAKHGKDEKDIAAETTAVKDVEAEVNDDSKHDLKDEFKAGLRDAGLDVKDN